MTTVRRDILIEAPIDAILAITEDVHRLPEWYAGIEQVEAEDDGPPTPGQVAHLVYKSAGVSFDITQTLLEYERGQYGLFQMEGRISGTNRWELAPEGDGTRVTVTFDYEMPGGALGKIADKLVVERMNTKNLEDSLASLKALAEG